MLGEVGGLRRGAPNLIPLIRELVERDDPILLHQLLEECVGLTNGAHISSRSEEPQRSRPSHRRSGPVQQVMGL